MFKEPLGGRTEAIAEAGGQDQVPSEVALAHHNGIL